MDSLALVIIITGVLLSAVLGAGIFLILKKLPSGREDSSLSLIKQDIEAIRKEVGEGIWKSAELTRRQTQESVRLIKEITEELVRVGEGQKQVMNIAEQLRALQDILKNPKQRGVLGEYYLEALLKNVMPPGSYQMQYNLGADEEGRALIADAVVFVKEKIIPIDSKFSLENYNRMVETSDAAEKVRLEKSFINDLKDRILETSKYIRPREGTMDFAFMFIPHEAIYYDLLTNKVGASSADDAENLVQKAAGKYRVIIVSPTSFLAYLQTVLQGLKAMQIEESAKQIRKRVEDLGRHIGSYETYMKKLGGHLGTTVSAYNSAYKELGKIDKDILRITGKSKGVETLELDKPKAEED